MKKSAAVIQPAVSSTSYKNDAVILENIFKQIVNTEHRIEVSVKVMGALIENDLKLKTDGLDDDKKAALPYMLMRYIRNWPGWSRKNEFDNGSLDLESWSLRFRKYIDYKMQSLVCKILPAVKVDEQSSAKSKKGKLVDVGTQSESNMDFSDFNIDISGPPVFLNNIVFSGHKDSIRIEQHAERLWVDLKCADVLNHPFVEVEFVASELSFKRTCEPKLSMFLSSTSEFVVEESNFILGKSSINSKCSKWPIKLSILESYIKAFKSAVYSQFQLSPEQQEEFGTVLDQFYQDMVDISSNNEVYENRRTTFNIGWGVYKRTKKIVDGTHPTDVLFNEMYLPRVISWFRYFTGMQHDGRKKIAADPEKIDNKDMLKFKPIITYKCLFCKVVFEYPNALKNLIDHLKQLHKRAQSLVCMKCNKCYEVSELSRRRWKCECKEES